MLLYESVTFWPFAEGQRVAVGSPEVLAAEVVLRTTVLLGLSVVWLSTDVSIAEAV